MGVAEALSQRAGYLLVGAAAALWAASGTMAKFLFQSGLSPFQLVQLRTTIGAAVLMAWLVLSRPSGLRIKGDDLTYFVVLGLLLAMVQFTYLYAISRIPVAAAILLQYQAPVFVALYAVVFSALKMTPAIALALFSAALGCYLMVGGYHIEILGMDARGVASGLLSAGAFAAYSVRSEHGLRTYAPSTVVFYALAFAALLWNVLQPPFGAFLGGHTLEVWGGILFVGILGTVLPFGLYSAGIRIIGAPHASITATLEPVMAGLIAYSFLGEVLGTGQIIGGMLVLGSVGLLQVRRREGAR